ncbi:MAG: hypothetical protein OXU81_20025, partial [Gammaproteobacteria bacterium]|nr:hypothetical protein [Gammaproteobacteria bacterium]
VSAAVTPQSDGAAAAAAVQGDANSGHVGDPRFDTADFDDNAPGNLRVDYVLPSVGLNVVAAGVFWPVDGAPGTALIDASDHRLVWVDVTLPAKQTRSSGRRAAPTRAGRATVRIRPD